MRILKNKHNYGNNDTVEILISIKKKVKRFCYRKMYIKKKSMNKAIFE
jgi:hypothetical protein